MGACARGCCACACELVELHSEDELHGRRQEPEHEHANGEAGDHLATHRHSAWTHSDGARARALGLDACTAASLCPPAYETSGLRDLRSEDCGGRVREMEAR
eukprot:6193652-Pleurochrysis_carterae.AAC.1